VPGDGCFSIIHDAVEIDIIKHPPLRPAPTMDRAKKMSSLRHRRTEPALKRFNKGHKNPLHRSAIFCQIKDTSLKPNNGIYLDSRGKPSIRPKCSPRTRLPPPISSLMPLYSLGLDFGTESMRALLVDISDGKISAQATSDFAHG